VIHIDGGGRIAGGGGRCAGGWEREEVGSATSVSRPYEGMRSRRGVELSKDGGHSPEEGSSKEKSPSL